MISPVVVGATSAVAFVVVGVAVRAVIEQPVVGAGLIAAGCAVAIQVIAVSLIRLITVVGGGQLGHGVIAVVARAVGRAKAGDPVDGIVLPGLGREGRVRPQLVGQIGQTAGGVVAEAGINSGSGGAGGGKAVNRLELPVWNEGFLLLAAGYQSSKEGQLLVPIKLEVWDRETKVGQLEKVAAC